MHPTCISPLCWQGNVRDDQGHEEPDQNSSREVVPDVDHQHLFIIVGAARGKKHPLDSELPERREWLVR